MLKPRFLYACAADGAGGLKILFFDLAWRGTDAAEFKSIGEFMSLEEMKLKIEHGQRVRPGGGQGALLPTRLHPHSARPDIILNEEQLQRIYEFPAGSVWDFFLAVLGVKKIPTTRERIETGFESYLLLYNFTSEQAGALRKIKDAFVANLSSQGRVDVNAIFANPIYARLIGSFEQINERFDGKLKEIVDDMQKAFKAAA